MNLAYRCQLEGRGIELLMRGWPILGLLGLAVGALVAIGPALHLVFAWGAKSP